MEVVRVKKEKKVALITGITGQDGSYLSELLLSRDIKSTELKDVQVVLIPQESIIFIKILMKLNLISFCTMVI